MSDKPKKYKLKYMNIYVMLDDDPRTGVCKVCGKSIAKGEIKVTQIHHWKYAYMPATVKANPKLALENTIESCYGCHQINDAIRVFLERKVEHINRSISKHPKWVKQKFVELCRELNKR